MEQRYQKLRTELDQLGYRQSLPVEGIPLIEKLLDDLVQTTSSLRKYMKIAQEAVEERDTLQLGAEPFKCDNAKLVKECNDLHLAFLQFKEQNERSQKDLKKKLYSVEKEKSELELENNMLKVQLKELELESTLKAEKLLNCKCKPKWGSRPPKPALKSSSTSAMLKSKATFKSSRNDVELSSAMALAEEKIASLSKEIRRLKEEQLNLSDVNCMLSDQLKNRDREIERLTGLLEGGRPMTALNKDCCYKDIEGKMYRMQDEIINLQKVKLDMEEKLKDAIAKQHEAMKRALHLAERNKLLEKEMRDIDQMALAVEAECNMNAKSNAEKVNHLQSKMQATTLQITTLERDVSDLKRDKQQLISELEALRSEKRHLQGILETALEDKKRLSDRINQLTIIENDLNLEIDRLVQLSANQKRRIAELESGQVNEHFDDFETTVKPAGKQKRSPSPSRAKGKKKSKSPTRTQKRKGGTLQKSGKGDRATSPIPQEIPETAVPKNTPQTPMSRNGYESYREYSKSVKSDGKECANPNICMEHMKVLFDKHFSRSNCSCNLEHIIAEKDYYMKECHKLQDQLRVGAKLQDPADLNQKLNEKEQQIMLLQHENQNLSQEKHNLMLRLQNATERAESEMDGYSMRSSMKRLERENELLKGDILRLEEERDAIRHRLKITNDNIATDHARMQKSIDEYEEQLRKLEQERRDLMHNQGSRRATITNLEEQCEQLQQQLKLCQSDLIHQKSLYTQIKNLQDQTDRALGDSQGQIIQLEKELKHASERNRDLEHNASHMREEINKYKEDILALRGNLAKIDTDKDSILLALDEKTERLAILEQELKGRDNKIMSLENIIAELKGKISKNIDDFSSKEYMLRNLQSDSTNLRTELEQAIRGKDLALQENRRLQEELAACVNDCRNSHNDLDIARRQVDDLRRQLQHYVAEVKRTEDLISQKEIERNEMLDQYKALTQEANMLENNNHSLESQATQSKIQLSAALSHTADLERKMEGSEAMIQGYERQISELTSQVASLEIQLKQSSKIQEQLENELSSTKDLCLKLDKQRDGLMKELREKEEHASRMDKDVSKLRRDSAYLQETLQKDRGNVDQLENLLADCRRENTHLKLQVEELQAEVQRNKTKLTELQTKLSTSLEQLDMYQEKALDYSQQNKQLRREIANERFSRSRPEESSSRYPSLYKSSTGVSEIPLPNTQNPSIASGANSKFLRFPESKNASSLANFGRSTYEVAPNESISDAPDYVEHSVSPSIVTFGRSENENPVDNTEAQRPMPPHGVAFDGTTPLPSVENPGARSQLDAAAAIDQSKSKSSNITGASTQDSFRSVQAHRGSTGFMPNVSETDYATKYARSAFERIFENCLDNERIVNPRNISSRTQDIAPSGLGPSNQIFQPPSFQGTSQDQTGLAGGTSNLRQAQRVSIENSDPRGSKFSKTKNLSTIAEVTSLTDESPALNMRSIDSISGVVAATSQRAKEMSRLAHQTSISEEPLQHVPTNDRFASGLDQINLPRTSANYSQARDTSSYSRTNQWRPSGLPLPSGDIPRVARETVPSGTLPPSGNVQIPITSPMRMSIPDSRTSRQAIPSQSERSYSSGIRTVPTSSYVDKNLHQNITKICPCNDPRCIKNDPKPAFSEGYVLPSQIGGPCSPFFAVGQLPPGMILCTLATCPCPVISTTSTYTTPRNDCNTTSCYFTPMCSRKE